jgi:hypothetical protein
VPHRDCWLQEIRHHKALCSRIEDFLFSPENQGDASWTEHQEIDTVILTTSLAPDGYFGYVKEA